MKRYNKPVVEINGFEVEDIIAVSYASLESDEKTAYDEYIANPESGGEESETLVFEW